MVVEVLDGYVSLNSRVLGEATVRYYPVQSCLHSGGFDVPGAIFGRIGFGFQTGNTCYWNMIPYGRSVPRPEKGVGAWVDGDLPISESFIGDTDWWVRSPEGTILVDWLKPIRVLMSRCGRKRGTGDLLWGDTMMVPTVRGRAVVLPCHWHIDWRHGNCETQVRVTC